MQATIEEGNNIILLALVRFWVTEECLPMSSCDPKPAYSRLQHETTASKVPDNCIWIQALSGAKASYAHFLPCFTLQ